MQSPHSLFPKWVEPKYSYCAAQGVTEVLKTECYSLQNGELLNVSFFKGEDIFRMMFDLFGGGTETTNTFLR